MEDAQKIKSEDEESENLINMTKQDEAHTGQHSHDSSSENNSLDKLKEKKLDFILDIPLKVTVELGRTRMTIKELLQIRPGSVLTLDNPADGPLDILVNGKLIAKGEVVVVNEKFGIRLTDVVNPAERIESLKT